VRALDWVKRFSNRAAPQDNPLHILVLTRSDSVRATVERVADRPNWHLSICGTCEEAIGLLATVRFPIVLYDRELDGLDWRKAIRCLANAAPSACILLASPVVDDYLWQEVVLHGGYDVLTKPLKDEAVAHVIDQALLYWNGTTNGTTR
jgi:DNA-binding response OmpR family regulator